MTFTLARKVGIRRKPSRILLANKRKTRKAGRSICKELNIFTLSEEVPGS